MSVPLLFYVGPFPHFLGLPNITVTWCQKRIVSPMAGTWRLYNAASTVCNVMTLHQRWGDVVYETQCGRLGDTKITQREGMESCRAYWNSSPNIYSVGL